MEKNSALKWIYENSKKYTTIILVLTIIMGLISVAYILLAAIASNLLDIAIGKVPGSIWLNVLYIISLIFLQALLNILYSNVKIRISGKLEILFKKRLFYSILKKDYINVSKLHSGDILNRMTSDIQQITNTLVTLIPQFFGIIAKITAGLFVVAKINILYAIIMVAAGSIFSISGRIFSSKFKLLHKEVQKSDGKTRSFIQECVENIMVIKAFKSDSIFLEKLNELQALNYKAKVKWNAATNLTRTSSYVFFTFAYFFTLTWGAFELSKGNITFGALTAILLIFEQIKNPILNMSGAIPQYYAMLASADRLIEIEAIKDEEAASLITDTSNGYKSFQCIAINKLSFNYGNNSILNNINLTITRGEFVALVGKSGIGKSTLFKLLLGLVKPANGEVALITSSNAIEVNSATRDFFAFVPQGNFVFSGTIKENICFASTSIDEVKLTESAKIACIYDDISRLPNGFNSIVGENGLGLSEGQLQRIAIARALYSDSPILLLDECTSALDEATEVQLLSNLKKLIDKTIILISHRQTAIEMCHKIFLFEEGSVKEI